MKESIQILTKESTYEYKTAKNMGICWVHVGFLWICSGEDIFFEGWIPKFKSYPMIEWSGKEV